MIFDEINHAVMEKQIFKLWYGEDLLNDRHESDNSGSTCVDLYAILCDE